MPNTTSSDSLPPRITIIGMGGYAARHHQTVLRLERAGLCVLRATCDPRSYAFAETAKGWCLEERGVRVYDDYRRMLASHAKETDIVIIPTPIPLHAEMHRAAVEAGLAVYLEKPPTLDPQELEAMIARDARARVPTLVGFNFIAEPARRALKQRLAAGEFGAVRSVGLKGLWGRSAAYYDRADWAGRLVGPDGRLILDSCLGNALSHHVHNVLHWASPAAEGFAEPTRVRCDLRRAHVIDGPDTVFLSADTDVGVPLRIVLSHACDGVETHRESVMCDRAEIHYETNRQATVNWRDGRTEFVSLGNFDPQEENLLALAACLRGDRAKPPTTLADSRPFVRLHALAYVSSKRIQEWPEEDVLRSVQGAAGFLRISRLREAADAFLEHGKWPFTEPAPTTLEDVGRLDATVRAMQRPAVVNMCS